MFKEVFSAAVGRPHPQGMPAAPQSRAIYAIDLMLKWDLNEKGKAAHTGQCQGFNIGHFPSAGPGQLKLEMGQVYFESQPPTMCLQILRAGYFWDNPQTSF